MLKWQLLALSAFDVICFADADLELVPYAEAPLSAVGAAWVRAVSRLYASTHAMVVAEPDSIAPLNTGLMLLKPDAEIFAEGVRVLERCAAS